MPGVQSFVAQRQQGQPNASRQLLGAQQRVPVPTTKLENTKQNPSVQRPNLDMPAGPTVAGPSTYLSREQSAAASAVQDGFDTDAEGLDDTATMSIGGSSRGHQGDGDNRGQIPSRSGTDAANKFVSETRVAFHRGQEQPHHVQESRQLDPEGSGDEYDEVSYVESADEEGDEETDEEELVRDEIWQDLNSAGFSQYLQGETSPTTLSAFQPVMASPTARSSLALKDVGQYSQRPANLYTSGEGSVSDSAVNAGLNLQPENRQAPKRAAEQSPAVPAEKVQGTSTEHPSITAQLAAQHRKVSARHEPSHQPSVISHQPLRPKSRARVETAQDIVAKNAQQPHAHGERPLSVKNGSIDLGDDDSSVDLNPNVDRIHGRKPRASVDSPQTRKRARDLDYSPNQLSSMSFQQLSNEPFNLASDAARASIPQELSKGTLATKMEYILERLKDDDTKVVQRRAFFSSLLIEQYEECANLMIRRFSDIISKFTDARQQRRKAAKDFEEEVSKREAWVRGKTTVVDKDLGRLKRGGEEVVRGAAL